MTIDRPEPAGTVRRLLGVHVLRRGCESSSRVASPTLAARLPECDGDSGGWSVGAAWRDVITIAVSVSLRCPAPSGCEYVFRYEHLLFLAGHDRQRAQFGRIPDGRPILDRHSDVVDE